MGASMETGDGAFLGSVLASLIECRGGALRLTVDVSKDILSAVVGVALRAEILGSGGM